MALSSDHGRDLGGVIRVAEQVWRDLRWVVESPSLVGGSNVVGSSLLGDSMSTTQADSLAEVAVGRHRVGHYFERLVAYWLQEVRGVEIVALGEQVRDGKRTIGELDCIFRDETGVLTHWELAVKFFLHHPNSASDTDFPGPNSSDSFERKTTRLFERQLPLSELARPDVVQRQALVRGCIFTHHLAEGSYDLPARMAAEHERGTWLRSTEIDASALFADGDAGAAIMSKPHWLAHPADHVGVAAVRRQLADHFAGRAHPLMVSVISDDQLHRVMVVNNTWPANNTNS